MFEPTTIAAITAASGAVGAGTGLYGMATAKDPKMLTSGAGVQAPQPINSMQNLPNLIQSLQSMRRNRGI